MSLKSKSISGISWTTISTATTTIIQLLQYALLARLLEPDVFGLMAIITIVIGFSIAFMDMGVSNAIIHFQEISKDQLSTLYWLNIFAGIIVFIILSLISPIIAQFYNEPLLRKLIMVLATSFIIQSFGQQFMVLMQKSLKFKIIAIIEIISKSIGLVVSVFLAFKGFGIYALVVGLLSSVSSRSFLYFLLGQKQYKVRLIFKIGDIGKYMKFGLYQMGEKSINYFSANIDKILIGRFIGFEALGFYNLAWQLIIFPVSKINPIINKVTFPIFAKIQKNNERINRVYNRSVTSLLIISIPSLIFLYYNSIEVVEILYGPGWFKSAQIVSILVFVGLLKAAGNPSGALLLGIGRADIGFWWNLFWLIVLSVGLSVTLLIKPDILIVSYSLLGLSIITSIIYHRIVNYVANVNYSSIIYSFFKIFVVSLVIGYIVQLFCSMINWSSIFVNMLFNIFIFMLLYLIFIKFNYSDIINTVLKKD